MEIKTLHPWNVSTEQAREIQKDLKKKISRSDIRGNIRFVAGADCSFQKKPERIISAVVLYDLEEDTLVEKKEDKRDVPFPYVPGLLSFREMPGLLPCFRQLNRTPDLAIADGHGYAHPRRFGLACHLGLFLDIPVIGCAKNRLIGSYETPGKNRGSYSSLKDQGEIIGSVLRTRTNVNPVFVSSGHKISLPRSRKVILNCGRGYKIPEPQRRADLAVSRAKK